MSHWCVSVDFCGEGGAPLPKVEPDGSPRLLQRGGLPDWHRSRKTGPEPAAQGAGCSGIPPGESDALSAGKRHPSGDKFRFPHISLAALQFLLFPVDL